MQVRDQKEDAEVTQRLIWLEPAEKERVNARAYELGERGSHVIVLGAWGGGGTAWLVLRPLKLSDH